MNGFLCTINNTLNSYYEQFIHLLPRLLFALAILVATIFVSRKLKIFTRKNFQKKARDPLLSQFLSEIIRFSIIVLGIVIVLGIAGLGGAASKILAGAGITAFILGFAFKDIGENFLAGIILAFKRPFHIGDIVESNGQKGKVTGMTLRETTLKSADGKDVFMPNSMILNTPLINYTTDVFNREEFTITLGVASDVSKAIDIVKKILQEEKRIHHHEKMPFVQIDNIAGANLNLVVRFWIKSVGEESEGAEIKSEVIQKTMSALSEATLIT